MEDTNTMGENTTPSPRHLRMALEALPSLDTIPPEEETDDSTNQTVIITHEAPANEETTVLSSTPEAEPTTMLTSVPAAEPTTVLGATPAAAPTTVLGATPMADPTTAMSATPAAKPTTVLGVTPAAEPTTVLDDASEPELSEEAEQALSSLIAPVSDKNIPEESPAAGQEAAPSPVSTEATYTAPEPVVPIVPETETVSAGAMPVGYAIGYQPDDKKHKVKKFLGRAAIVCGVLVALSCVVYIIGGFYFMSHFLPNTTVNGNDVSGFSIDDLNAYVTSIGDNYKAHITGDGIDLTVSGPEINFGYDGPSYSSHAADQINNWNWPFELSETHEYVVNEAISFDNEKLNELVGAAVDKANEGASQPTNASIIYNEGAGAFEISPDALGTAINKDAVLPVVSDGVATMQTEISLGDDQLVQPTIRRDDANIQEMLKTVNGMLESSITLKIAGADATTIDKSLLASWLSVNGELNIDVNQDAIKEWAQGPLSEQFDTVGTKRTYTRPDGKVIEVEGSSADFEYDYGWCLDGEALAQTLADNLRNKNCDPIDVPMKKSAATWNPGGQEWGNRYIDVDLSEQHVRMYDENSNVIWESDCVSGNPIYGGGTDTGVFFIYMKANPMELIGLDYDHDGQPDYRTWVTYWMPFDGGEGLHDMATRYSFGGNIYTWNGSHGCVNLPYSAAEQLYGLTNVGDPVIVHW